LAAIHIIQHDDIRAGVDSLISFCFGLDFYIQEKRETANLTGVLDGCRDGSYGGRFGLDSMHLVTWRRTGGPNVVILEHDHAR